VGHENGGVLTEAIKKSPYTVLLLDEIEKAHPDIFNILLQVMDHGRLTDALGRTTNFKNVILIMTTNAGAKEMEAGSIGLGSNVGMADHTKDNSNKREQALKNFFSPEFRNRLDGIVFFSKLGEADILSVVDKFLAHVEERLAAKGVNLIVTLDARHYIAKNGFDEKLGARPIERFINDKISRPLSKELLFGRLEKGGAVEISLKVGETDGKADDGPLVWKDGELFFQFRPRGVQIVH
ncbi:MAG: AAA family ATPase, partial [Bdellovibrionota bacterium]